MDGRMFLEAISTMPKALGTCCHSREDGNPYVSQWKTHAKLIPASAGMTGFLRWLLLITLGLACILSTSAFAATSASEPKDPHATGAKPAEKKVVAPDKLVDINSASKAELKKLPFIDDEAADRIIATRPFLTKAHLVTKGCISPGAYEAIKNLVIAKQDTKPKK